MNYFITETYKVKQKIFNFSKNTSTPQRILCKQYWDFQLSENHVPIPAPGVQVFDDPYRYQIQHPPQGVVVNAPQIHCLNNPYHATQPIGAE